MLEFMSPVLEQTKNGNYITPKFVIGPHSDLIVRGGDFYAVWDEEFGIWTKNWYRFLQIIDNELYSYRDELAAEGTVANVRSVRELIGFNQAPSLLKQYLKICGTDIGMNLDSRITFAGDVVKKEDLRSRRLPYNLTDGPTPAWDKLMHTLYPEEELEKLEWAIGAIVSGDSINIQKFMVLYGEPGSGKSTFLNILQQMFPGYWTAFSSSNLGMRSDGFALEPFKENPLIGIEHDGDLSRIEDNTRINSLVSHETMDMNEKFKSRYSIRFNTFLFLATNKPVKITDAQSGIIRRLIDVWPGDDRLPKEEYDECMAQIPFEFGNLAKHCLDFYKSNSMLYSQYKPRRMIAMTDHFFDFMLENAENWEEQCEGQVPLKVIWNSYKAYVEEGRFSYPYQLSKVKAEAMNYYYEFKERIRTKDNRTIRNVYSGLRRDKLFILKETDIKDKSSYDLNDTLYTQDSIFDKYCGDWLAQYTLTEDEKNEGKHLQYWENVTTTLKEIDTSREHLTRPPVGVDTQIIMIDFDYRSDDDPTVKDLQKNIEAARYFPPTYTEVSKSGGGLHLYYKYIGDISKLARNINQYVEIKTCIGKASFRRKVGRCNSLPIAEISSGLPLKEEKVMVDFDAIKDERHLRNIILKHLKKAIVPSTTQSISLIVATLKEAYDSGMHYDVTDLRPAIMAFAAKSTNHPRECLTMMNSMIWHSDEPSDTSKAEYQDDSLLFFDVEVYPNLFVVVYKVEGEENKPVVLVNPTSLELEPLFERKLIGFNCRRYDNHICYARHMGYSLEDLFILSQRIIAGSKNCMFSEAYNLSYTDIYDFAAIKQSLKKWEIDLSIHHQEMGIPWDQPVPEELIPKVCEYCCNDVMATEAVFHHLKADWEARLILAAIAGLTPNDTTNTLTGRIVFGNERNPQGQFIWRNMAVPVTSIREDVKEFLKNETCLPFEFIPQAYGGMENPKMLESASLIPYFPGYSYQSGKSMYRGEDVGNGGYVYAEPGIHRNVALLDIASMHPTSAILECIFGPYFTKRFKDIKDLRVMVKHKDLDVITKMWDGILVQFIQDPSTLKALAYALKIAINSVYGLTSAVFANLFKDPNNIDNIVAKRGALFMVDLKHAVQEHGFQVAHIKTDSIKIPNATPEIIQFVMDMGHYYGYDFEHEATYDKMALVNNAVYICKHDGAWDATGTQFAVPYVFKTLFSKEPILFADVCETRQVKVGSIYLDFNEQLPDVTREEKFLDGVNKKLKETPDDSTLLEQRQELQEQISVGHDYQFVGRIGLFCPIKEGHGGARMMCRRDDGTYSSVAGTKDYRWLEAEYVEANNLQEFIDYSYYNDLVDKAVAAISTYGDINDFLD